VRVEISVRAAQRTAHGELGTLYIRYNVFADYCLSFAELPDKLSGAKCIAEDDGLTTHGNLKETSVM
jgi:hypothetical protein